MTKPEDPQIFLNIQLSYQILSDENKRKLYDESGDIHIAMGLNHSEKSEKEWKNYFNGILFGLPLLNYIAIFNKVTIDELIKFEKEYKGELLATLA